MSDREVARFRSDGYLVLRGAFDPEPLSEEMDRAFADGLVDRPANVGSGGVEFRYVPMMCEHTPVSLALVDTLAVTATELLGRPVLPGRAKGTTYSGSSAWHHDSDLDIPSLGFVAYREPLGAADGALRVRPGSHGGAGLDEEVLATEPGDVIAFDEHLVHGSVGGRERRQWRSDFVADPVGEHEEAKVGEYFDRIFSGAFGRGYDAHRYPSYGPSWQALDRSWTMRLRELGVYTRAAAYEARG